MFKKSIVLCLSFMFLFAGSVFAIPDYTDLQDYFDSQVISNGWPVIDAGVGAGENTPFSSIDDDGVYTTEYDAWEIANTSLTGGFTLYYESNPDYALGIYSTTSLSTAEIFESGDTTVAAAGLQFLDDNALVIQYTDASGVFIEDKTYTFYGETFGFYAQDETGKKTYSNPLLNDVNLSVGFQMYTPPLAENMTPGQYIFAVEMGGTENYRDIIFQAESISTVPEPTTMLLLGSGLLGMGIIGKKRKFLK